MVFQALTVFGIIFYDQKTLGKTPDGTSYRKKTGGTALRHPWRGDFENQGHVSPFAPPLGGLRMLLCEAMGGSIFVGP